MKAIPEFCKNCKICETCQGGCKASAEACYSSIYEEDPFLKVNKSSAIPIFND